MFFHKNINYFHPDNSILLEEFINNDNVSLTTICEVFNKCKYFYCYDPNTMYIFFSAICGCIPIIYPIENVSKIEYLQNRIFNCNSTLLDFIAYGNDKSELQSAEENIKNIDNLLSIIYKNSKKQILDFLQTIQYKININNTSNNVFNINII